MLGHDATTATWIRIGPAAGLGTPRLGDRTPYNQPRDAGGTSSARGDDMLSLRNHAPFHYPQLVPPPAWTYFVVGSQLRLIPPGTTRDTAPATLIISPIVTRQPHVAPLQQLIALTVEADSQTSFEAIDLYGPIAVANAHGLGGVRYELVGYARNGMPVERRLYAMLGGERFVSAATYRATPEAFARHVDAFWTVIGSLRPFEGHETRVLPQ